MGRYLFNRPQQRSARRQLRSNPTPAEAVLWQRLRKHRLAGRRFRRQFSVGPYILDFYCPAERLAVELDGGVHDRPDVAAYDAERTRHLGALGIRVLRFENRLVFEQPEVVCAAIRAAFTE